MELTGKQSADAGPLKLNLQVQNATIVPGKVGNALRFDGPNSFATVAAPQIDKLSSRFTVTMWVSMERFSERGAAYLVQKGGNAGWQFGIDDHRKGMFHGSWGGGWYAGGSAKPIVEKEWVHVAYVMNKGDRMRLYFNGDEVLSAAAPFAYKPVGEALKIGGGPYAASIDEVKIFAVALTKEQIGMEMQGKTLLTRAAVDADLPESGYGVRMALARFDKPLGFRMYDGRVKQTAQRVAGPDATDWPTLRLEDGRKLFQDSGQADIEVKLVTGYQAMPAVRQKWDHEIQPVNHWFRANDWRWGRSFVYTTDRTARTSAGEYEIWAFPITIADTGAAKESRPIQRVILKLAGETIYERAEPLHSLTLLLPANLNGAPYELSVNGSEPVRFDVGLLPIVPNHPVDVAMPVDAAIPGSSLRATLQLSQQNANPREWSDDVAAVSTWKPRPATLAPASGMLRYIGGDVPRSPLTTFTASMRAGMSGGHAFDSPHTVRYSGTPTEYAEHLAGLGFDFVYETAQPSNLDNGADIDQWARELEQRGVRFGLNPTIPGNLDILANPNLALLSTYLPEWGLPAYRDAQLLVGRFKKYANFGGLMIGADNAGYVTYWDWAPTIPDRPWARAWEAHMKAQGKGNTVPVGPAIAPGKVFERRGTERQFLDYIAGYDSTFSRYGYFARAVREADPAASFTTGSYGSSPGVGARGGWPWATIPARPMHDDIPLLTAYDWNEMPSTKSMHLEALIDRLQSEYPGRPLQALVDDFGLHLTREARQQAYALALTRGVQSIGTTFLAHPKQRADKLSTQDDQRELYAWIHRFSGAYAQMKLKPVVGVLYVHKQAISRPVVGDQFAAEEKLLLGSHEGKTTEALFFANAAGFPAKIVTPTELSRGLDPGIKAIMLVGLNRFDSTWAWSDDLEPALKAFVARGGVLVRDEESVLPAGIAASTPGLQVRAYVTQSGQDQTKLLLDRNSDNIAKLRVALAGVDVPVVQSAEAETWAITSRAGDIDYVTLVNQGMKPAGAGAIGRGEDAYVAGQRITEDIDPATYMVPNPRVGAVTLKTQSGIIYDLRSQKKVTIASASKVDFTKDAFQVLAVAPRAVAMPVCAFEVGANGFWAAKVSVGTPPLRGVPVQIDVTSKGETVTVYGASGTAIELPLPTGEVTDAQILVRENISGLVAKLALQRPRQIAPLQAPDATIVAFWRRTDVPLVIAVTPAQAVNVALCQKLGALAAKRGRDAKVLPVDNVVRSLQPLRAIQRYPQWQTIDADLILLGSPQENVLVMDQARGGIIDDAKSVQITMSPFVGEKWALNIRDEASIDASVGGGK
jgi:hypothetical protein